MGRTTIRLTTRSLILLAAATALGGCFSLSYISEPVPEPPRLTKIEPPENPPVQRVPDYTGLLELEKAAVKVYHDLNRGVVNITSVGLTYTWFFQAYPQSGSGSGAIINQDGVVLTNYHVIKGADQLAVTLYDGSRYLAKVVGVDPENDLALISFDPEGRELATVPLGSSERLQVGQMVLALGNPFGLERTLTTGIISGLDRPLQNEDGFLLTNLIQTDASINPGNSGGPLLDSSGRLIGINTMILSPSAGSVGVGFAVPVDTAKRVIPDLEKHGRVIRGWIQITAVPVYPSFAIRAELPIDYGVLISQVKPQGNAARAGLQGGKPDEYITMGGMTVHLGGDIIVGIGRSPVRTIQDFFAALEPTDPGEVVEVEIDRGGERLVIDVTLSDRPDRSGW
jgi:S1-C subfamily serine protease